MADTPKAWAIIETLQARLRQITVANGYRTDAGADVRLERNEMVPSAPYIALAIVSRTKPDRAAAKGERELSIVAEAHVPCSLANAARCAADIAEDIEDALTEYLQQPLALPLEFVEGAPLERPEGLPVIVEQTLFTTKYRR